MSTPFLPTQPPRTVNTPGGRATHGGAWSRWLLGRVPERRGPLKLTLLAVVIYGLFALIVAYQAHVGMMAARDVVIWTVASLGGILGFYALIRTGASERLGSDPSMTLAQNLFGQLMTVYGYAIDPPLRGAVIAILVLNMVWGMFVLRGRQAIGLCVYTLGLLAAAMAWKSATLPDEFPPRIEMLHFAFAVVVMVATSVLSIRMGTLRVRLAQRKLELQRALVTIRELAQVDELTRLSNRRHILEALAAEQARAQRSGDALSVVLVDLDHFKVINDRHGHAAGDAVLSAFADALRAGLRDLDAAGRWGGEEFLLLLPQMSAAAAAAIMDGLREAVARLPLDHVEPGLRLSFSAGVAECGAGEAGDAAIERADRAMYQAKQAGRACTVVAGEAS